MGVNVQATLDERTAKYVYQRAQKQSVEEAAIVQELVESAYDQLLDNLHAQYERGELTFRSIAAELGLSTRELYALFEQKHLSL